MQLEGSRKIIFGFVLVGIGIALDRYLPNGLTANMLELMKFVTIGFFLGNGVEHVTKCVTAINAPEASQPNPEIQYLSQQFSDMKTQNQGIQQSLATVQQAISFIIEKAGFNKK